MPITEKMIDKKWYQFKLIINRQTPSETTVIFPLNPEDYPPAGIQIHKYLLQQGLFKQRRAGGFYYVADSNEVNLDNLESLYYKFKEQGADIKRSQVNNAEYITKAEFERFKAETKKFLMTIEQELQGLEKAKQ